MVTYLLDLFATMCIYISGITALLFSLLSRVSHADISKITDVDR